MPQFLGAWTKLETLAISLIVLVVCVYFTKFAMVYTLDVLVHGVYKLYLCTENRLQKGGCLVHVIICWW